MNKQKETMFYVYLISPCGEELIGTSTTLEGAKEIQAAKDKDWEVGDFWFTEISTSKRTEKNYWD